MKKYVCDKCKYYGMIDSGYGFCKRFPPTLQPGLNRRLPTYQYNYPIILWDNLICGEFKKREEK